MSGENISTKPGDRNNWPRKTARKYRRLEDAIFALEGEMDEANQSFALREFISERERLAIIRDRRITAK